MTNGNYEIIDLAAPVKNLAVKLLKEKPEGIKTGELARQIYAQLKDKSSYPSGHGIYKIIFHLDEKMPTEIYKPFKGRLRHVNYKDLYQRKESEGGLVGNIPEKNFYQPFADWLMLEEECTKAVPLGDTIGANSWGNPDVVGINEPKGEWRLKHPIEIVTAEIKSGGSWKELITAFGQACSYRLFSHKTYIVVPNNSDDLDKIDSLSLRFGIGLVIFENNNLENPEFEFLTRAYKHEPDMGYLNEFVERERIRKLLFEIKPE
ncbi:MAG: hypothetical protein A2Z27_03705 [candidate division Zixibacteria bacterium RBG_16_50_21]|nr:MAG: hypothetical protein A2Z27_03705 [candidate division Zixibacteria bacterium RBG_16_50_21]